MSEKVYKKVARFPSGSSAGKFYVVKEDQDGNLSCDCPAWRFKKPVDPKNRDFRRTRRCLTLKD